MEVNLFVISSEPSMNLLHNVVLPKFGPEPKFEPELLRTGLKSSSKFSTFAEPDLEFSSGFSAIEEVRTRFEPTLVQQSQVNFLNTFFQKNSFNFGLQAPIKYFWKPALPARHKQGLCNCSGDAIKPLLE